MIEAKSNLQIVSNMIWMKQKDKDDMTDTQTLDQNIRQLKKDERDKRTVVLLSRKCGRPYEPGEAGIAFFKVLPEFTDENANKIKREIMKASPDDPKNLYYMYKDFLFRTACMMAKYDDPNAGGSKMSFELYLRKLYSDKKTPKSMCRKIEIMLSAKKREDVMKLIYPFIRMAYVKGYALHYGKMMTDLLKWGPAKQEAWARAVVANDM